MSEIHSDPMKLIGFIECSTELKSFKLEDEEATVRHITVSFNTRELYVYIKVYK